MYPSNLSQYLGYAQYGLSMFEKHTVVFRFDWRNLETAIEISIKLFGFCSWHKNAGVRVINRTASIQCLPNGRI
jgi:hypothetical protein